MRRLIRVLTVALPLAAPAALRAQSAASVPDLAQLLGPYFEELRVAARSPVRRRQPLIVRTRHLVFENGGQVRAFRGRAYLPDLVPASVSLAAVR